MANQRRHINRARLQPRDRFLKGVAQRKAADDRPIVAKDLVRADLYFGVHRRHTELQILTAWPQVPERRLDHAGHARCVDHDRKAVRCDLAQCIGLLFIRQERGVSTELRGERQTRRVAIHHHDLRRAGAPQRLHQQQSHRSRPKDQHIIGGMHA